MKPLPIRLTSTFGSLLFGATTFLSGYTLQYYKFHGSLPGYDSRKIRRGGDDNIDPDKAAFSMAPHDDEAYERVGMNDHEASGSGSGGGGGGGGSYEHANPYSADDYDDPNRYGAMPPHTTNTMFDTDTEYKFGAGAGAPRPYAPPSSYDEPAQFPAGDYDRTIH